MKYLMIIGDGMADEKIPQLGGKTPLQCAAGEGMNRLAGGTLGRIRTCPAGMAPGSDVAFLTLMGHDPRACYRGRSPLEAAGEQVSLAGDEVSFRVNLISLSGEYDSATIISYNGDGIDGADARAIAQSLVEDPAFSALMSEAQMRITVTDTFRHIAVMKATDEPFTLTPPHDISGQEIAAHLPRGQKAALIDAMQHLAHGILKNHPVNQRRISEGRLPANGIWFWGAGRATVLDSFPAKFGKKGTAVSAVPLVRGIAWLSGLKAPRIPGATGTLDTNYQGKVDAALHALLVDDDDFVLLHLEAPDDLSHLGDLEGKLESIRRLDERMVRPMLSALDGSGQDYRVLLMPDHYTLLSTKTHDGTPVPFALYDSRRPGESRLFCEEACDSAPLTASGEALLNMLFERAMP